MTAFNWGDPSGCDYFTYHATVRGGQASGTWENSPECGGGGTFTMTKCPRSTSIAATTGRQPGAN